MARSQVLAVAILAAWIMSTLCMWFAATRSFATVDRIIKGDRPEFVEITKPLEAPSLLMVVRHTASEINRSVFWGYGVLQIVMGAALLLLLWKQQPRNHIDVAVAATMLILAIILTVVITPWVVSLGRSIDFLPRNPPPPVMPHFWALHGSFTGLDGVKLLAGISLLIRWIFRA